MRLPPAPLRFLAIIVGGWIGGRVAMVLPSQWMAAEAEPALAAEVEPPRTVGAAPVDPPTLATRSDGYRTFTMAASRPVSGLRSMLPSIIPASAAMQSAAAPAPVAAIPFAPVRMAATVARQDPAPPFVPLPPLLPRTGTNRLAMSAWLLVRSGETSLAPGVGTLGASQAGVRATYRIAGHTGAPLSLSLRLTAALDRPAQSEAAFGLDWRPLRAVPIHILAERRQAIGSEGRSDFAVTVYGGGTRRIGPVIAEGYAQAGMVGRDAFADGSLRVTRAVGPVDVGGGVWGGAQPGAARVDAGPHVSARMRIAGASVRAAAEWRLRIAGDAAPASGPAFTLATDF